MIWTMLAAKSSSKIYQLIEKLLLFFPYYTLLISLVSKFLLFHSLPCCLPYSYELLRQELARNKTILICNTEVKSTFDLCSCLIFIFFYLELTKRRSRSSKKPFSTSSMEHTKVTCATNHRRSTAVSHSFSLQCHHFSISMLNL